VAYPFRLTPIALGIAVALAAPAAAGAYVGEVVTGPPDPRVVIAEGQFAEGGVHEDGSPSDGRWSLEARKCGDRKAEHAQFLLLVADHPRDNRARQLCYPGWSNNPIHEISVTATIGSSRSVFARTMYFGGVSPRTDAVELLIDGAWVATPVRRLAPGQIEPTGLAPDFAFYYLETPATSPFAIRLGARAYSGGRLVDCIGECGDTPGAGSARKAKRMNGKRRKGRDRGARGGKRDHR
jgi:hypothetical protein